jgi:hypothetical protein
MRKVLTFAPKETHSAFFLTMANSQASMPSSPRTMSHEGILYAGRLKARDCGIASEDAESVDAMSDPKEPFIQRLLFVLILSGVLLLLQWLWNYLGN